MKRGMLVSIIVSCRFTRARLAFWSHAHKHDPGRFCTSCYIMQHHIYTHPSPLPTLHPHQPPQPHPPPLPTIQPRPHVQIERQPASPPAIKINHILHLTPPTPLHHPIMAIKRALIPPQPQPPRARTHPPAIARETPQPRPAAPRVLACSEPCLPPLDLSPRTLVDGVMDRYHGRHIRRRRVVVLTPQRLEEHLLRWVDPVGRWGRGGRGGCWGRRGGGVGAAWDRTCDSVGV